MNTKAPEVEVRLERWAGDSLSDFQTLNKRIWTEFCRK